MENPDSDHPQTIAFVGDSLTASGDWAAWFSDADVLNFGVSGYTSDDVLASIGDIVQAAPHEILMLIGTNDLGLRRSVEHMVRNIESALVELRRELPGTRLLLQSILPRTREFSSDIQTANIHLRQFCATVRAQYLDLWPRFALADGSLDPQLSSDGLHLNQAGYDAWLDELRPALEALRGLPPMSRPIPVIGRETLGSH
ncbi:lysophospholipase L1-like esterase [Homoserinimonas aerilata]|uniref:Lysophospholipase L1-like esterase n=1 Tax=Homoserinimonas aerilata TaxID=1162970 RepID=A0A542YK05_9MICO|nr:GDSL-type esterase/lipase family protein [Homoserinimonas aerilata]TQL48438.1 lysophospholipase L1-like esterase [Homoserinimonas aerilata]